MVFGSLIGLGVRAAVGAGIYATTRDQVILVEHDTLSPERQNARRLEADYKRNQYEANLQCAMDRVDSESGPSYDFDDEADARLMARRRCCLVLTIFAILLGIVVTVLCFTLIPLTGSQTQSPSPANSTVRYMASSNVPNEMTHAGSELQFDYADGSQSAALLNMTESQYSQAEDIRLWDVRSNLVVISNHPVCCIYSTSPLDELNDPTRFVMTRYRYHESSLSSSRQLLCDGRAVLFCYADCTKTGCSNNAPFNP